MKSLVIRKIKLTLAFVIILGLSLSFVSPSFPIDLLLSPPPKSMDKYYAESGKTSEWIIQMQKISSNYYSILFNL